MLCTKSYISHRNFAKFMANINCLTSRENIFDLLEYSTWSTNHITVWFAVLCSFVASYSCEVPVCRSNTKYRQSRTHRDKIELNSKTDLLCKHCWLSTKAARHFQLWNSYYDKYGKDSPLYHAAHF